ncbi:hypothetical protein [Niastella sp. OAS944]|uniref:hypothetical protein n=1 Tax=Niastella sp. OAS944 TaxID=2664089 RepID=UPI003492752A|nr:hypothetical protein [Chitinophagaceae bacterium OAS944]
MKMFKHIVSSACLFILAQSLMAQNTFPAVGRVGIGTSSPQNALDVVGGSVLIETNNDPVLTFNNNDNSWQYLQFNRSNVRQLWMGLDGGQDFYFTKETQGNLVLNPMNGQVVSTSHLRFDAGREISFVDNGQIRSFDDNHRILFRRDENKMEFREYGSIVFSPGATNALETSKVVMLANGSVGIGTNSPGNFKLAVEGGIAARSVKVTTAAFADYVFEPTYKLRPLSSVESYINENKHLPGMPSAKEVEKDGGFELGNMNVKLLEKIEELTLYVIELKKENEQMKKEIKDIRKKK